MASSREALVASVSARLTSSELNFITNWKGVSSPLLEMLPSLDDSRLYSLDKITELYFATRKSRILALSFLSDPTRAEETWENLSLIAGHADWLMANENRYDKVIHLLMQLRDRYGVTTSENGRIESLMAHLKVQADYTLRNETLHMYLQNEDVIRLVEEHYEGIEAFISYAGARGYMGLNHEDFREYLTQHDALQEGWL